MNTSRTIDEIAEPFAGIVSAFLLDIRALPRETADIDYNALGFGPGDDFDPGEAA
jgi:hypothetical protein